MTLNKEKGGEMERTGTIFVRWTLVSCLPIAIFWAIYYLIKGDVPTRSHVVINISGIECIFLPFNMSRWCDILIGPVVGAIFAQLSKRDKDQFDLQISGLLVGAIIGSFL